MKISPKNILRIEVYLIAIMLSIFGTSNIYFERLFFDEIIYAWTGDRILHGEIPYRDFFEMKPPMIQFINALGIYLFKDYVVGPRIICFLILLFSQLFIYIKVREKWDLIPSIILVSIPINLLYTKIAHISFNNPETIGFAFFVTTIYFACKTENIRKNATLSGIGASILFLTKEQFAPIACIIPLCVILTKKEGITKKLKFFTFGSVGTIIIFGLYLTITNSLLNYINTFHVGMVYSKLYSPYLTYSSNLLELSFQKIIRALYLISPPHNLISILVCICFFVLHHDQDLQKLKFQRLFILSAFILSFTSLLIAKSMFAQYYLVFFAGIYGSYLAICFSNSSIQKFKIIDLFFLSTSLLLIIKINIRQENQHKDSITPYHYMNPKQLKLIKENTNESDYIFSTGTPEIYLTTKRKNATIVSYISGNTLEIWKHALSGCRDINGYECFAGIIKKNSPKVAILYREPYIDYPDLEFKEKFRKLFKSLNYKEIDKDFFIRSENN